MSKILEAVEKISMDIHQEGFDESEFYVDLSYVSTGWMECVSYLGQNIWDSENDSKWDDEGNEIDIEKTLREKINEINKTLGKLKV